MGTLDLAGIAERLAPPSQPAIDRAHARIHAEMDAALVRLHATFDQLAAEVDASFARIQRDMDREVRALERQARPSVWARLAGWLRAPLHTRVGVIL